MFFQLMCQYCFFQGLHDNDVKSCKKQQIMSDCIGYGIDIMYNGECEHVILCD